MYTKAPNLSKAKRGYSTLTEDMLTVVEKDADCLMCPCLWVLPFIVYAPTQQGTFRSQSTVSMLPHVP